MKRWKKRTLTILALGAAGLAALLLRPALTPDDCSIVVLEGTAPAANAAEGNTEEMSYTWQLDGKPAVLIRGDEKEDAFSLLHPGTCQLRFRVQDGRLHAETEAEPQLLRTRSPLSRATSTLTVLHAALPPAADGSARWRVVCICEVRIEPPFLSKPIHCATAHTFWLQQQQGALVLHHTPA